MSVIDRRRFKLAQLSYDDTQLYQIQLNVKIAPASSFNLPEMCTHKHS